MAFLRKREKKKNQLDSFFQRASTVKTRSLPRALGRVGSEQIARWLLLFRDSQI